MFKGKGCRFNTLDFNPAIARLLFPRRADEHQVRNAYVTSCDRGVVRNLSREGMSRID